MPCVPFQTPDGARGFVCGPKRRTPKCVACGGPAGLLCDWKTPEKGAGRTCDRPVCSRCAHSPAPGKDLCPEHTGRWLTRSKR